jgi:biotin synthase
MLDELLALIHQIRKAGVRFPISISSQPLDSNQLIMLQKAGIDRISIPLDASTASLFDGVKGSTAGGPYRWAKHIEALKTAVQVFGKGNVSTHFIVGLGERDDELLSVIQKMVDMGVYPSLFAFTPVRGTKLEEQQPPQLVRYRRIQLAHYLIRKRKMKAIDLEFDEHGWITSYKLNRDFLRKTIQSGNPFMTSGCPGCNRPFYNERVGGPRYNFPSSLSIKEIEEIETLILGV